MFLEIFYLVRNSKGSLQSQQEQAINDCYSRKCSYEIFLKYMIKRNTKPAKL